ncbi:putative protein kinase UbiB [Thalassoglobus neptunius]|uniref:ABC1 atypical kinase-like domain-containing protein n=1 Tax=Thalassoglobus neptunius TaxID=1938619 RepID=A0A5C5WGX9_9PLAN|nr:AarF/ABC1/UbiB kinase family protein [Thalassoglobus neptunius]TWT49910.1 putative protein kinase UbiB [Thalassoglobus neptunius]
MADRVQPYPLRFIRNVNRGREIATVLLNYGFGDVLERLGLLKYLKWGRRVLMRSPDEEIEALTTATRIRLTFQDLGPTFVKFGQVLSTRPDLVPTDVIVELKQLQEQVPPFSSEESQAAVLRAFKKPTAELYATFDETPLAAGSLGQVHCATDFDGRKFAVKIRRPDVQHEIERDLSLMLEIAQLLENHIPESKAFDPVGLVNHFSRTVRREMNYQREARTMREFKKLFQDDCRLIIPDVDDARSCDSILTMEFVDGVNITDLDSIRSLGLSPSDVATTGADIFMKQAFEFGIFHGDPHPGNLRVHPSGAIILLDYGMIGFLSEEKRDLLIDLLLAVTRNDVESAVSIILELGQPTQEVEEHLLKADVRDFIDAYYGVDLGKLNIGSLLNDFITILANHGLRCPGDLILLIRSIVTLDGIGRQLCPKFNLANVLAPKIETIVKRRYDPKRIAQRTLADMKKLFQVAHDLPIHLGRTLQKVSQDDLKVQFEHKGLDRLITEFDRSSNRIVVGVVISSLVVAAALIIRTTSQASLWVAVPMFMISGFLGLWLVWGILRSGRL